MKQQPIPNGQDRGSNIVDNQITTAKIGSFDPDLLTPEARAQWDSLGKQFKLNDIFDDAQPFLSKKLRSLPLFRKRYLKKRLSFTLSHS